MKAFGFPHLQRLVQAVFWPAQVINSEIKVAGHVCQSKLPASLKSTSSNLEEEVKHVKHKKMKSRPRHSVPWNCLLFSLNFCPIAVTCFSHFSACSALLPLPVAKKQKKWKTSKWRRLVFEIKKYIYLTKDSFCCLMVRDIYFWKALRGRAHTWIEFLTLSPSQISRFANFTRI